MSERRVRVGVSCILPFDKAIPRLSVLLIAEEEQSESRRRVIAALNAKRWDRVSAAVTKLVPRLRGPSRTGLADCFVLSRNCSAEILAQRRISASA